MIRTIPLKALMIGLVALLAPACAAQEMRPHSILVLDQSDGGPFYHQIFSGLREVVGTHTDKHVTVYNESLDLNRFQGGGPMRRP
ncbi:MAG: hypothetical protein ABI561_02500 [Bradyrhizobium sp.]